MTNIYNLNKDELVLLISEIEGRTKREYEEKLAVLELEIKRKDLLLKFADPGNEYKGTFCDVKSCNCYFLFDRSNGDSIEKCKNLSDYCRSCHNSRKCQCHGNKEEKYLCIDCQNRCKKLCIKY